MHFTEEQRQAIFEDGKNIIVSAGAGSGKTAVLTERVKQKLLSGIHVNELLVLTFTSAASLEMKDRIRKAIFSTPEIIEEANYIDGAYICTFDSFSLSVLKKYHTEANISSDISVCDEVIIDIEKKKIIDEIFDEYYMLSNKKFLKLIRDFCLKDDKDLKDDILNAYRKIELKYDKEFYLDNYSNLELSQDKIDYYVSLYMDLLYSLQKDIRDLILELHNHFEDEFVLKMEDNFSKLLNASTYDDFLTALDYASIRVPKGSTEEGKRIKQTIFDIAKSIKTYCVYESTSSMIEEYKSTFSNIEIIVEILKKFDKKLDSYKKNNNLYTFTDISRLAIKIVSENEDIRLELTDSFKEILVDEYQDTSDLQEKFISLISSNNVYMVGDIKQSIYRFRNANPSLFMEKYNLYKDPKYGLKIDLLNNFRSRREVLNNINSIFDLIMDQDIGGADYSKSHRMIFGNTSYDKEFKTNQNNDMDILVYDLEKLGKLTKSEEEAFIIGYDILNKINDNYLVFDKDKKILRKAEYKDFVILLEKSHDFLLYKKVFEYLHIPINIHKDESFKKDDDSLVIRNLFRLLICIKQKRFDSEFRYTFTSISRSFLWNSDDSLIYDLICNDEIFESELYKKCLELVNYIDKYSLSEYFLYVVNSFDYTNKLLTLSNIKSFRIRLEYFYNLCVNYEKIGKTIYDFCDILNNIFENDYDLKFNVFNDNSNSVSIMTIHKSKGLEFPICYFGGFSSLFSKMDLKEKIIYDNKYGFILPKVDNYYKDTFLKTIYKNNYLKEDISERIRLLYVALTRAREKIIIVIPKQEEESYVTGIVPLYIREKYNSFLSIIKSIYNILLPYVKEVDIVGSLDYLVSKNTNIELEKSDDNLLVEEVNIDTNEVIKIHYSKEQLQLINIDEYKTLEFGSLVHNILETINFSNYDLDKYNVSNLVKEKINNFLKSDFMKNKLTNKMYKEYEFIDDNSHGIIDLIIDCIDHLEIIDYKLKNIDDLSYDKQLLGYKSYLEKKTKRKVKCYLYSIFDEEYREI